MNETNINQTQYQRYWFFPDKIHLFAVCKQIILKQFVLQTFLHSQLLESVNSVMIFFSLLLCFNLIRTNFFFFFNFYRILFFFLIWISFPNKQNMTECNGVILSAYFVELLRTSIQLCPYQCSFMLYFTQSDKSFHAWIKISPSAIRLISNNA